MTPYTFLAVLLAVVPFILGCGGSRSDPQAGPKFSELSAADSGRLDQQRALVAAEAKKRYGTSQLTRSMPDLKVLQRLIDDHAFSKTQSYELQSLGVAFGDVLASELNLRWVMITDEFGTDPTLRLKDTSVQVNALTMISKRIERNEPVSLVDLLETTRQRLPPFAKELRQ